MSPEGPPLGVVGVGVDLVENARMRETLSQWGGRFKHRVFVEDEQAYCESKAEPWRHYAGRFAVKEAVSKAFGTGVGEHVGWLDIEVTRNHHTGAPSVRLTGKAGELAQRRGVRRILVSLSHTRDYAVAEALLLGEPREPEARR
ncbi:MAG: holo-ACP synthase [Kiritimatiellae bacterium]|nr:holo-ACP synthase [Kiritimatiellia bacterium]